MPRLTDMGTYTNLLHLTRSPKPPEPEEEHPVLVSEPQAPNSSVSQPDRTDAATERKDQPNNRSDAHSERLQHPNNRSVAASERSKPNRPTVRYSFEFYADQIESIRRVRAQRELEGKKVGLSDIVRESIDQFLQNIDPK